MVALPGLDSYSPAELAEVGAQSPAFQRYARLIEDPNLDALSARRHRAWCECVAATNLGRASTADICAFWSQVADEVLTTAWRDCGLDQIPALLVAFGKLGAGELNLSSDVDLLVIARAESAVPVLRALRKFQARVGGGADGFCFRLDFDLRPGGRTGPLVTTPAQFQDHYWTQGEPWERLAMVRLRPITGDAGLRDIVEDLTARFAYRRHLDYTLIEDLRRLRAAVHQKGFTRRPGEINLKLEVGGIRDIELFTHLQQVIHGGRIDQLRERATSAALARLSEHGILDPMVASELDSAYWTLRDLENRVQSIDDRQVHEWPEGDGVAEVHRLMARVDQVVSSLLGVTATVTELPVDLAAQAEWLRGLGFSPNSIEQTWPQLIAHTALSRHAERDETARLNFLFRIVRAIARSADRDLGLTTLAAFVRAVRGKASLFTLFLNQPALIDDVARYVCTSPYLGAILTARPELLDQLVRPVATAWSSDSATLLDQLSERKLLTEIWGANQITLGTPIGEVCSRVSDVADQSARLLLERLCAEYPQTAVRVLALGKWGGRELGLRSDLDFVFVTETDPSPDDLRVARRFITRVTDPSGYGALYDVDLRLRPSGQSGPLMLSAAKLRAYWRESAAAWERQAYLRLRPIDGTFAREGLCARALTPEDVTELRRIRLALLRPASDASLDLKYAPGGLLDIEFVVQTALLVARVEDAPSSTVGMIEHRAARDPLWRNVGFDLIAAYDQLRMIEQGLQVSSTRKVTELAPHLEVTERAANLLKSSDLWERTRRLLSESRKLLNELDPLGLTL